MAGCRFVNETGFAPVPAVLNSRTQESQAGLERSHAEVRGWWGVKDGVAVQLQVSLLDQVSPVTLSMYIISVVCLGFAFHVLNFNHQSRLVSGYHQPQVTAPGLKKTKAIERPRCPHPPWQNRYEAWWKDGLDFWISLIALASIPWSLVL